MSRNYFYSHDIYEKVNKENKATLDDYILELKSKRKSQGTIYQYTADIKMFFCWIYTEMENKSILKMKKRDFRRFFLILQESGTSAARINRVQCSIRTFLAFCSSDEDEYDYDINVMQNISGLPKERIREIHFLSNDQIEILIKALLKKKKYQQALYVSLSYESAARRNEIAQIKKEGFLESKMTNEVVGKRNKKFKLIYFNKSREIAKLYFEQRGEDNVESLWVSGKDENKKAAKYETLYGWTLAFRKILQKETGEYFKFNPHSFRHSSLENFENGTHYVLKEMGKEKLPLEVLKIVAHHSDISTTQSYLRDKDDEILNELLGIE